MIIQKQLAPSEPEEPTPGTVMCYGTDYASITKHKTVPEPYKSTMYYGIQHLGGRTEWLPEQHTTQFGRLLRMLPGRICELDTTPDK